MQTRKVAVLGLMLTLSMVLSYIESQLPMPFGVPGMKLGLSNLMVVLLLFLYGAREALLVNLLRIVLTGFLFGGFSAILFSLAGALAAFVVMLVLKKTGRFGIPGVSLGGGVAHNAGQLVVAALTVHTYRVMFFIPYLMIAGCITGLIIGLVADRILPVMKKLA